MSKIKLLNLGTTTLKGTVVKNLTRLQSQLYLGKDTADFILENGVLKNWTNGINGFDFYETKIPYEIFENKEDMFLQPL